MASSLSHRFAIYLGEYIEYRDPLMKAMIMTHNSASIAKIHVYVGQHITDLSYKLGKEGVKDQAMNKALKKRLVPIWKIRVNKDDVECPPVAAKRYRLDLFQDWLLTTLEKREEK